MSTCVKCGCGGAKTLLSGGRNWGLLCWSCAIRIDVSVTDPDGHDPRYSDDMFTREMYHRLTSAPNSKWKGY